MTKVRAAAPAKIETALQKQAGPGNGRGAAGAAGRDTGPARAARLFGELGVSGLSWFGGRIQEEFLRELRGREGARAYREMSLNDPTVGSVLYTMEALARGVPWSIEAADDSPEAQMIRDFVHGALFQDMHQSWANVLSEILTKLVYGWSYFEVVFKRREGEQEDAARRSRFTDGRLGWRKWAIRGQDTLDRWELDEHDGIQGLWQAPPLGRLGAGGRGGVIFIPIGKALLFRTRTERNNPEGRSILRNAYRPWYFKKRVEEIEGIGIERDLAGLPVLVPPEDLELWNEGDAEMVTLKAAAEKLIRNIKRDKQEGVLLPHGWELKLLSTGSRRQFDTTAIIERYDTRIALTVLADFVLLGHQVVGSFALHADKTHLFALTLGGLLDQVQEVINAHAIPDLIAFNGWPRALAPRLRHGDFEKPDLAALATFVTTLTSAGLIRADPELERRLRELGDLPALPEGAPPIPVALRARSLRLRRQEEALVGALLGIRQDLAHIVALDKARHAGRRRRRYPAAR